jgi:hypothetical protein
LPAGGGDEYLRLVVVVVVGVVAVDVDDGMKGGESTVKQ